MAPSAGGRAGRISEEVGAVDDTTGPAPAGKKRERIAFVTGKLAEHSLRGVLADLAHTADFEPEIVVLNIQVAALLTAEWAARRLELPPGVKRAVVPGYMSGDLSVLEKKTGVSFARGPKDLRELPRHFGKAPVEATRYGASSIQILAEINHVPRLAREAVLATARRYRRDGADIVDLGCDPGGPFLELPALVRELKAEGFRVSVDSLDPREILPAVEAGAELVLSANESNLPALRGIPAEVVLIPESTGDLDGLARLVDSCAGAGLRFRIDPVLEPIGFGFAQSLGRYLEVRRRWPDAEVLLGVGNLTELTGADSAAINLVLLGFCEELGIRSVLTTEVISWASTSVRELDLARRVVRYAVREHRLPKHIEPLLHLLRDPTVLEYGEEALEGLARGIRDRNFRLFAERGEIHILGAGQHLRGTDPFALFERLGVEDPSHAFYLGYELAKAVTALTLGKNYVQDEALRWGYLTREEPGHLDRRNPGQNTLPGKADPGT